MVRKVWVKDVDFATLKQPHPAGRGTGAGCPGRTATISLARFTATGLHRVAEAGAAEGAHVRHGFLTISTKCKR
jgi:hypothetical protein